MALLEARSPTLRGPPPNGRRAGEPNSSSAPTGLAHRSVGRPTRCAPKVHGVAVGVASMTRRPSGSDFFGLGNTLRSLTMSPATAAIPEAHRMARRRLEAGGPAAPAPRPIKADPVPADYVLPLEVPADEVFKAIEAKLGARGDHSTGAPPLIQRKAGGRVAVAGYHILRLGD